MAIHKGHMELEIPYNYDGRFLESLTKLYPNYKDFVSFVYIAPFCEHSPNSRSHMFQEYVTMDIEEYEEHLALIRSYDLPIGVTLQGMDILSEDILRYYIEKQKVQFFMTVNDENAKLIKKINSNCITIASICKAMTKKQLLEADLSMYDRVVVDFRLNKLETIKELSKKFNCVCLSNPPCSCKTSIHTCQGHWLHLPDFDPEKCQIQRDEEGHIYKTLNDFSGILPSEMIKFSNYVTSFKLQGRECLYEIYGENALLEKLSLYLEVASKYTSNGITDEELGEIKAQSVENLNFITAF